MFDKNNNNSFWYLIKTKARQEKRAKDHLERQNIEVFCPEVNVEIVKKGELSSVSEILFPGYLFVRLSNLSSSASSIRSTRGVLNFVSFGQSVATVPLIIIEAIKEKVKISGRNLISKIPQKGDKLFVSKGSLKGVNVIFSQTDGRKRAIVLMKIMNQEVKASMEYSDLSLTPG